MVRSHVTTGLEANSERRTFTPTWLKEDDTIEIEITGMGCLRNRIVKVDAPYSILANKKNI
ncbi:MAG: hypothetical protein ACUZ8E_13925 [Candidatus Anammoxibacter sp.]